MRKRMPVSALAVTVSAATVLAITAGGHPSGAAPLGPPPVNNPIRVSAPAPRPAPATSSTWAHTRPKVNLRTAAKPRPAARHAPVRHLGPGLQQAAAASSAARMNVAVTATNATVATAAVRAVGGSVLVAAPGSVTASVPPSRVPALAVRAGVTKVAAPVPAFAQGVISEGVAVSGANGLQDAGITGAGVKIGIVDVGFKNLNDEMSRGNLPSTLTLANDGCTDGSGQPSTDGDQHGTAVAEIVHQMAPAARLYLFCVADSVGFATAMLYDG